MAQASVDQFDHAGHALQARGSSGKQGTKDGSSSPTSFLMASPRAQSPAGGESPLSARQQEKRPAASGGGDSLQARLMNLAGGKGKASAAKLPAAKAPIATKAEDIPLPPSPELRPTPDSPRTGDPLSDPLGILPGKQVALPSGMVQEMVDLSKSLTQGESPRRGNYSSVAMLMRCAPQTRHRGKSSLTRLSRRTGYYGERHRLCTRV